MATEFFRLVRMLPTGAFEYLVSDENGSFVWSDKAEDAKSFASWQDFVAAAHAYWLTSGPVDIIFDRVYVMPSRAVCHA